MIVRFFEGSIDDVSFKVTLLNSGVNEKVFWESDHKLSEEQESDILGAIQDTIEKYQLQNNLKLEPKFSEPNRCPFCNCERVPENYIQCSDCHHFISPYTEQTHLCIEKAYRLGINLNELQTSSSRQIRSAM